MRVLVGGVAYRNLRDYSFGTLAIDALAAREWPAAVSVEDLSYNPIAVVQRLEDDPADRRFSLAIVIGVAERGRAPGTLAVYRWDRVLPPAAAIQGAIAEAVTGVISLDNTLIVARHFDALPADVVVIEVEPAVHEFGDELSPPVAEAFTHACDAAVRLALDPASAAHLREAVLGGGTTRDERVAPADAGHAGVRIH